MNRRSRPDLAILNRVTATVCLGYIKPYNCKISRISLSFLGSLDQLLVNNFNNTSVRESDLLITISGGKESWFSTWLSDIRIFSSVEPDPEIFEIDWIILGIWEIISGRLSMSHSMSTSVLEILIWFE